MHYVYIIKSQKTGELYKGSAEDLRKRMVNHNQGKVVATKHGVPWKLVYYEAFASKKDALREELFLKSGKGRERIKWLLTEI
jgi:putative endonuclease